MIIYTIAPIEEVLKGFGEESVREVLKVEIGGIPVLVERTSSTSGQILRILSSDPQDFLNPTLQPGTLVHLDG